MKDFYSLFVDELKRIMSVEKQIVEALPKVIEKVSDKRLKEALQHHLQETHQHVSRLQMIGKELNQDLSGAECGIIKKLIEETDKILESDYDAMTKDAGVINCLQRIEHYEIETYGSLKSYADELGYPHIVKILEETAKEEGHANKKLTEVATGSFLSSGVNKKAHKNKRLAA